MGRIFLWALVIYNYFQDGVTSATVGDPVDNIAGEYCKAKLTYQLEEVDDEIGGFFRDCAIELGRSDQETTSKLIEDSKDAFLQLNDVIDLLNYYRWLSNCLDSKLANISLILSDICRNFFECYIGYYDSENLGLFIDKDNGLCNSFLDVNSGVSGQPAIYSFIYDHFK